MKRANRKHLIFLECTIYTKIGCKSKLETDEERVKGKEI